MTYFVLETNNCFDFEITCLQMTMIKQTSAYLRKANVQFLHTRVIASESVEVFVINSSYNLLIKFTASPIISSSIILCGPGIILMLYRCTVHSKPLLLKVPKLCIFLLPIAQNRRISNPFLCAHEFIYLHFLFTIMPKVD